MQRHQHGLRRGRAVDLAILRAAAVVDADPVVVGEAGDASTTSGGGLPAEPVPSPAGRTSVVAIDVASPRSKSGDAAFDAAASRTRVT